MAKKTKEVKPALCMWFARCFDAAVGLQGHSVLGWVPVCERCAKFVGKPEEFLRWEVIVPGG